MWNVGKYASGGRQSFLSGLASPFDVVALGYKMPGKDGMEVAKEILQINPHFASVYFIETLKDFVKELSRVVELLQKPFTMEAFVNTVDDNEAYEGLQFDLKYIHSTVS